MSEVENFDFDAAADEIEKVVQCTFTLKGRTWRCRSRDEIDAQKVNAIVGGRLTDFEFFQAVLVEEDVQDFAALLASADTPLPFGATTRLVEFMVAEVLNRPTERPASSESGPRKTKRTSGGVSSSAATQQQRSAG